jgi:hypothetical protein
MESDPAGLVSQKPGFSQQSARTGPRWRGSIADTYSLSAKQYATLLVRLAMSRIRALSITAIQLVLASSETGGLPSAGFHAALVRLLASRAVRRRARLAVWATAQRAILLGARLAVARVLACVLRRVRLAGLARRDRLGRQQRQERPSPGQTTQRLPSRPALPEAAHQSIKPFRIQDPALHTIRRGARAPGLRNTSLRPEAQGPPSRRRRLMNVCAPVWIAV